MESLGFVQVFLDFFGGSGGIGGSGEIGESGGIGGGYR